MGTGGHSELPKNFRIKGMELSSDGSAQKALNGAQLRSSSHLTQDFDHGIEPADRICGPAEAREGGILRARCTLPTAWPGSVQGTAMVKDRKEEGLLGRLVLALEWDASRSHTQRGLFQAVWPHTSTDTLCLTFLSVK